MPKNPVTDPITVAEIAFAQLVMSGTMTDREAAEAAGLKPDNAAYTKSKPRVRAYMDQHTAAVTQKLADEEAKGLRNLNLGRDQILARLWVLANLSPEETRGSIAGQIKALSMIVTMEGLIPDGRRSSPAKPIAPSVTANIFKSDWLQPQSEAQTSAAPETVTVMETQPAAPPGPETETHADAVIAAPFRESPTTHPETSMGLSNPMNRTYDTDLSPVSSLRLPQLPGRRFFPRGR